MKNGRTLAIQTIVSSLAVAAMLGAAGPAQVRADPAKSAKVSCLTYLSQFQGAVPYYAGAPGLPQAQDLAAKGRSLCLAGDEAEATAYLTAALREIGVAPKGIDTPPKASSVQEAARPPSPTGWEPSGLQ